MNSISKENTSLRPLPIVTVVFLCAFMFDFRGEAGGSVLQYCFALIALLSGALSCFILNFEWRRSSLVILAITSVVIALGLGMALFFGVDLGRVVRISFPFVVFLVSFAVGTCLVYRSCDLERALLIMAFAGIVSQVFRYFYATRIAGVYIDEMRYQMLTPALPSILAFAVVYLLFSSKINVISVLALLTTLVAIFLSVTRSFVITLSAAIFFVLFIQIRIGHAGRAFAKTRFYALGLIFALGFLSVNYALVLRPDLIDRWAQRLFESRSGVDGSDVTFLTRKAEAEGIIESVSNSPITVLFGRGFGAEYSWSGDYAPQFAEVASEMLVRSQNLWAAPHSVFTHALLFGGVCGVAWISYIYATGLSILARARWKILSNRFGPVFQVGLVFSLSLLLYITQSLTSNPLAERMSAQYLGISFGSLFALRSLLLRPVVAPPL